MNATPQTDALKKQWSGSGDGEQERNEIMTDELRAVGSSLWFTAERRKRSQQQGKQTTWMD